MKLYVPGFGVQYIDEAPPVSAPAKPVTVPVLSPADAIAAANARQAVTDAANKAATSAQSVAISSEVHAKNAGKVAAAMQKIETAVGGLKTMVMTHAADAVKVAEAAGSHVAHSIATKVAVDAEHFHDPKPVNDKPHVSK